MGSYSRASVGGSFDVSVAVAMYMGIVSGWHAAWEIKLHSLHSFEVSVTCFTSYNLGYAKDVRYLFHYVSQQAFQILLNVATSRLFSPKASSRSNLLVGLEPKYSSDARHESRSMRDRLSLSRALKKTIQSSSHR